MQDSNCLGLIQNIPKHHFHFSGREAQPVTRAPLLRSFGNGVFKVPPPSWDFIGSASSLAGFFFPSSLPDFFCFPLVPPVIIFPPSLPGFCWFRPLLHPGILLVAPPPPSRDFRCCPLLPPRIFGVASEYVRILCDCSPHPFLVYAMQAIL